MGLHYGTDPLSAQDTPQLSATRVVGWGALAMLLALTGAALIIRTRRSL